jgi:hypothetical protein
MAGKLLAAGVTVDVKLYRGAPHSFIEAAAVSSTARQALEDGAVFLRRTFNLGHERVVGVSNTQERPDLTPATGNAAGR